MKSFRTVLRNYEFYFKYNTLIKKRYHVHFVKLIARMRNVQRYFIFRASSFAKFVCRSRKWQPRRCASQIYISKHPERHNRRSFLEKRKKRKEEKESTNCNAKNSIFRDYKKKILLSNYLEQNKYNKFLCSSIESVMRGKNYDRNLREIIT